MPYIKPERRERFSYALDLIADELDPESAGELNYVISTIVNNWVDSHETVNYSVLNEAHGTFYSAAAELYRRRISSYEDQAIAKNGDIY